MRLLDRVCDRRIRTPSRPDRALTELAPGARTCGRTCIPARDGERDARPGRHPPPPPPHTGGDMLPSRSMPFGLLAAACALAIAVNASANVKGRAYGCFAN